MISLIGVIDKWDFISSDTTNKWKGIGWYYAEFVHKEVRFAVTAEGVSQDEVVEIITSVLD